MQVYQRFFENLYAIVQRPGELLLFGQKRLFY